MAHHREKEDPTTRLPKELLYKVFSYLSLRDKLRLVSVCRRFQNFELLKMLPEPLEFNTVGAISGWSSEWSPNRIHNLNALRALAKKSKFSSVKIILWIEPSSMELMEALQTNLLETECLDKVVSFESNFPISQDILEKLFAQCVKLSSVKFTFVIGDGSKSSFSRDGSVLNLNAIFNNKAITQLDLQLVGYAQDELAELFQSLKPRTLQKLSLLFDEMPPLDLSELVKKLSNNAWAALQEIDLDCSEDVLLNLDKFFDSLVHLPALKKCKLWGGALVETQSKNQFVAVMTTALFKSDVKITLSSWESLSRFPFPACEMMAQIRQVQKVHPHLRVDFDARDDEAVYLTLSLGNVLFEEGMGPYIERRHCADAQCVDCHSYYPAVLALLRDSARYKEDANLENYRLDKCRIDSVVEHLNIIIYQGPHSFESKTLSVEMNEPQDLVTVTFEVHHHVHERFKITVGCGPCFSSSCIQCIDV